MTVAGDTKRHIEETIPENLSVYVAKTAT